MAPPAGEEPVEGRMAGDSRPSAFFRSRGGECVTSSSHSPPFHVSFETTSAKVQFVKFTRRSSRVTLKKRGSLIVVNLKGNLERLPCVVLDKSQGGFRIRVSSRFRAGQAVEVALDEDASHPVQCSVVWTGKAGSQQEGQAGLQREKMKAEV